ncbi:hypothetical protein SLS63_014054 [Diaporthe eres]|uniref:Major facilitator superfamily (MFS) profile domain-containing protein n=1 Tax=Diaporthe eres TaxID=83184 RepID=A0ABR1NLR5_DIAER
MSTEVHAVTKGHEGLFTTTPDALSDLNEPDSQPDVTLEKRYLRKVGAWLVGFYSLVYIFRVIDSANYSNAAIINLENGTGIKKQLSFTPSQWSWTLSIFSYSYMIFEPSNTILLKTFKPSVWMFVLILLWGVSACSSAAAQDFAGMMCVRFAIGAAEAGFFPAVLYHMAFWYKTSELPQRIAIFYSVGQLSSALSGLLAYAISFMDGLGTEAAIVISYIVLFTVSKPVVKYIFLLVAVACAGSAYPIIWPERIRALEGTVASGFGIGFYLGNTGVLATGFKDG